MYRLKLILILFLLISMRYAVAASSEIQTYDWFWFVYEKELQSGSGYTAFRPFYYRHYNTSSESSYTTSLPPVIFSRYVKRSSTDTRALFGLLSSVDYKHQEGADDYDFGLFPFLYLGLSENERDSYFILWPLGGSLKGKFALEEINAYIFPGIALFWLYPPASFFSLRAAGYAMLSFVPVYASYSRKEYKAWSLFWPLIQRGRGGSLDEIRVLPFYARNSKTNWYNNYSFLMLINYQTWYFTNDTRRTLFIFPFYGRKWSESGRISSHTILWPFFSWGYDKKNNDYQYNLPWPLVQIRDSQSPKIKKRIFFPVYGDYSYGDSRSRFITPLYFHLNKKTSSASSDYYIWGMVLYWQFQRESLSVDPYYGRKWNYYKLWPLLSIESADNGLFAVNFLSLFPFRDPEGYEAVYGPLWTLFEYKELPQGEKRLGFLLRTYYQRWSNNYFDMKIPFLLSYNKSGEKESVLKVLFPLFEYRRTGSGIKVRIACIPVWNKTTGPESETGAGYEADPAETKRTARREPHLDSFRITEADNTGFSFRF